VPITIIKLSDPVNTLVNKTNTISRDLGDVSTLVTGDSDVVTAINTLNTNLNNAFDSVSTVLNSDITILQNNLDSDVVDLFAAIDSVKNRVIEFDDSAEIITIAREGFSLKFTGTYGTGTYDSDNGRITLSAPSIDNLRSIISGGDGIDYDTETGEISIADNSISSQMIQTNAILGRHFNTRKTIKIVSSDGGLLHTFYYPGA